MTMMTTMTMMMDILTQRGENKEIICYNNYLLFEKNEKPIGFGPWCKQGCLPIGLFQFKFKINSIEAITFN